MSSMKFRTTFMSHGRGRRMYSSSTLSEGIVSCDASYRKLFKRICVGSMGRNGRNTDAAAMLNMLPKLELVPMKRYLRTLAESSPACGTRVVGAVLGQARCSLLGGEANKNRRNTMSVWGRS